MAAEVIIEEYASFNGSLPIPGVPITTQVLNIADLSAKLNAATKYVRIASRGTGFWFKFGDSSVSAVANTAGNIWVSADQFRDHAVSGDNNTYIDTAAAI